MTMRTDPEVQRRVDGTGSTAPDDSVSRSRSRSLFVGIAAGAVTVVVLVVFLLQNDQPQDIELFWWDARLRTGAALLLAAAVGALLVAVVASVRVLELRRVARQRGGARSPG